MRALRLLIAEDNEEMCLALSRKLQSFHYVRCCTTGTEALEILRSDKPDILVLNMFLPEIDGLTLLEQISSENIRPMVLALTSFRSEYLIASAHRLGIAHILSRPSCLDQIVVRVLDMKDYLKSLPPKRTPELVLEEILRPLGITPTASGYRVLREAIVLAADGPERILCKTLFPDTAKHCAISAGAVESSIRRTIKAHWDRDTWQRYFPGRTHSPTVRQFLQQITCLLRSAME